MLQDHDHTTVKPTEGFILSTPKTESQKCFYFGTEYSDGKLIKVEDPCKHCYCMKGDIVCAVPECGLPFEHEEKNCTAIPPKKGQCCSDTYICDGLETVTIMPEQDDGSELQQQVVPQKTYVKGATNSKIGTKRPIEEKPKDPKIDKSSEEDQLVDHTESSSAADSEDETDEVTTQTLQNQEQETETNIPISEDLTGKVEEKPRIQEQYTENIENIETTIKSVSVMNKLINKFEEVYPEVPSESLSLTTVFTTIPEDESSSKEQTTDNYLVTIKMDLPELNKTEELKIFDMIDGTTLKSIPSKHNEENLSTSEATITKTTQKSNGEESTTYQKDLTELQTSEFLETTQASVEETPPIEKVQGKRPGTTERDEELSTLKTELPTEKSYPEIPQTERSFDVGLTTTDLSQNEYELEKEISGKGDVDKRISETTESPDDKLPAVQTSKEETTQTTDSMITQKQVTTMIPTVLETAATQNAVAGDDSSSEEEKGVLYEDAHDHPERTELPPVEDITTLSSNEESNNEITDQPETFTLTVKSTLSTKLDEAQESQTEIPIGLKDFTTLASGEEQTTKPIEIDDSTKTIDSQEAIVTKGESVKGSAESGESIEDKITTVEPIFKLDEEIIPSDKANVIHEETTTKTQSHGEIIDESKTKEVLEISHDENNSSEFHLVQDHQPDTTEINLEVNTTDKLQESNPIMNEVERLNSDETTQKSEVDDDEQNSMKKFVTDLPSLSTINPVEHLVDKTTTFKSSSEELDEMNTVIPERGSEVNKLIAVQTTFKPEQSTEPHFENISSTVPGEGYCLFSGITYKNNSSIPTADEECLESCVCFNSVVRCKSSCDFESATPKPIYEEDTTATVVEVTKPFFEFPAIVKEITPSEGEAYEENGEEHSKSTVTEHRIPEVSTEENLVDSDETTTDKNRQPEIRKPEDTENTSILPIHTTELVTEILEGTFSTSKALEIESLSGQDNLASTAFPRNISGVVDRFDNEDYQTTLKTIEKLPPNKDVSLKESKTTIPYQELDEKEQQTSTLPTNLKPDEITTSNELQHAGVPDDEIINNFDLSKPEETTQNTTSENVVETKLESSKDEENSSIKLQGELENKFTTEPYNSGLLEVEETTFVSSNISAYFENITFYQEDNKLNATDENLVKEDEEIVSTSHVPTTPSAEDKTQTESNNESIEETTTSSIDEETSSIATDKKVVPKDDSEIETENSLKETNPVTDEIPDSENISTTELFEGVASKSEKPVESEVYNSVKPEQEIATVDSENSTTYRPTQEYEEAKPEIANEDGEETNTEKGIESEKLEPARDGESTLQNLMKHEEATTIYFVEDSVTNSSQNTEGLETESSIEENTITTQKPLEIEKETSLFVENEETSERQLASKESEQSGIPTEAHYSDDGTTTLSSKAETPVEVQTEKSEMVINENLPMEPIKIEDFTILTVRDVESETKNPSITEMPIGSTGHQLEKETKSTPTEDEFYTNTPIQTVEPDSMKTVDDHKLAATTTGYFESEDSESEKTTITETEDGLSETREPNVRPEILSEEPVTSVELTTMTSSAEEKETDIPYKLESPDSHKPDESEEKATEKSTEAAETTTRLSSEDETKTLKPIEGGILFEKPTKEEIGPMHEVSTFSPGTLIEQKFGEEMTTSKHQEDDTQKINENDLQAPLHPNEEDGQEPVDHNHQVPEHPFEEEYTTSSPSKTSSEPGIPHPSGYPSYDEDYTEEDEDPAQFGPGTCRYGGKLYVSAQQIPRDDPCDFCFCFRSDIICLQQSCPPPIQGCHEEPIAGFCCPRYECHVAKATLMNITTSTTTTTTTLPPHFLNSYKGASRKGGCQVHGKAYAVGEEIRDSSGPCMRCA